MRKMEANVILQQRTFDDPWGLGCKLDIRRSEHADSGDSVVEDFINVRKKRVADAREASMKRTKNNVGTLASLLSSDAVFANEVEAITREANDKEQEMAERLACSYLASWRGDGFKGKDLPKDGTSGRDKGLAFKVFFQPLSDDDDVVIPRFREVGGKFVQHDDLPLYDTLCEIAIEMNEKCEEEKDGVSLGMVSTEVIEAALNTPNEEGDDLHKRLRKVISSASMTDPIRAEKAKNKIQAKHEKAYHVVLKEKGYEEVPCYGQTQRIAWTNWITEKANDVEISYQKSRGFLQKTS